MTSAVKKWGRIQGAKIPPWSKTRRHILARAWAGGDSYDAAVSFLFFLLPVRGALRFHHASLPTSLCYSFLPPTPPLSHMRFPLRAPPVWLLWGEAARQRETGPGVDMTGADRRKGVVKLLHHGQNYSSCSTGAGYLRNCWCSLHRSGSCVVPSSRLLQWLTAAC